MESPAARRDRAGGPARRATDTIESGSEIRTFLIADVRGYTGFTQERGDEAAARLAAKFAGVVREHVEARDGTVLELRGDEALAVFASPRQAIRAAVELQARFLRETTEAPELPLPVGIGLDAGEAVPVEGGFRGGALNTAARLCAAAGPGEILGSQSVVQLARRVEGVSYVDRGALRLKGLADPVHVSAIVSGSVDVPARMEALGIVKPARRTHRGTMQFRLLGPLEVHAGAGAIPLGGPKQRAVLAHLLLRPNQLVTSETLIDELWGDEPPESARNTLQTYMSLLRKALGEGRLVGRPPGYVLFVDPSELDSSRFDDLLRQAKKTLSVDPSVAVTLLDDALALWRGPALADVAGEASLVAESARLDDLRLAAQEERIDGLLASNQATRAIGEAEGLLALHPLRERLWSQLMVALYRDGRQADALGAFQRAREILADELGIDPSPELARLQERILHQDPALDLRGEALRGYRLMEKIGEGPTGVVFRGIQPRVGRDVAVKVIHERLAGDGAFVRRFEPEAQAVAALEHPHVAPIYDYWRDPAGAYVVSRYLRGGSLRAIEERGERLEGDRRRRIVQQVASAVAFAHRQGVAHGSIQAANVVMDAEGNAYLCDFRVGTGPPPTIEEDLEQLAALARRMLGEEVAASVVVERLGVGEGEQGAAALANALEPSPRGVGAAPAAGVADARNPYKGLRPFAESDQADFFGRAQLVQRIVARLNETGPGSRFLGIVGPSGSGKSSVVRAGVAPAIRRGALSGPDDFVVADMFPSAQPLEELEGALLRVAARAVPRLRDRLEAGSRGLLEVTDDALPPGTEAVLIVDQFEELFTLTRDDREREHFLESLRVAAADPASRLRVIVTLRADFFDRPLGYPRFGELLGSRTEVVPPLTPDELEQAIRGPAERVGVRTEPGLIAEMIADVAHQPGALPLLQYALTELFDRRENHDLTLVSYGAIGGATGALSARAERLHEGSGPDGRRAIRQVLLRLATLGEGREDTRRRVVRSELDAMELEPAAIDGVLEAFGRHRLLTFDREPTTREPTVEIAHEALLGSWARLRGWIDEAREDLRLERQVSQAGAEWRAAGRDPSFLLRGSRLDQAQAWVENTDLAIGARERVFVKESEDQHEREQEQEEQRRERESRTERRSRSRLRTLVAVLAIAALVASGLTVIAVDQTGNARRTARFATARELAAAAVASLEVDPERTILLALQAIEATRDDGIVLREAQEALHRGIQSDRLLFTIHHPSTANVAWSPDGRLLATGGTAGGLKVTDAVFWDARTGELVRTLSGHTEDVSSVAFSLDGTRLVTTGDDDRAIVWDTTSGERLLDVEIGEDSGGASFGPDGERLVATVADGDVRMLDASTGAELATFGGADGPFCTPTFSPDGGRVAASGCSGADPSNGAVWDVDSGRRLLTLEDVDEISGLVYSPDGERLVSRGGDVATVWDAHTGEKLLRLEGHTGDVFGVAFSRDGTRLATGGADGTARIWDAETGEELLRLAGHDGIVVLVDFSPDGTRLLTGGGDSTARVWDVSVTAGAEWWSQDTSSGGIGNVSYSPDGARLLTSGNWGTGGWVMRSSTGEKLTALPWAWEDAAFSPDGSTIAGSTWDERYDDEEGNVHLMDASSGELVRELAVSGWVPSVAYGPDGSLLATGLGDTDLGAGRVVLWDAASGRRVRILGPERPGYDIWGLAFDPDGSTLAVLSGRGRLDVWGVDSGEELLSVQAHSGFASDVAFSPDGSEVATAGADGAALWSMPSGRKLVSLSIGAQVEAVAFSPDGAVIATAGVDRAVRLWDAESGRQIVSLGEQIEIPTDIAFSPDGTTLASGDRAGVVRAYALRIDDLVRLARQRLTRELTDHECFQYLHLEPCPASLAGPLPPAGPPVSPTIAPGPRGAFRARIDEQDLVRRGFPEADAVNEIGDYTMGLFDGIFRLHQRHDDGETWETSGTYAVSGDRIVFTESADARCAGSRWSATWQLEGATLAFSDISSTFGEICAPESIGLGTTTAGATDSWIEAVLASHPWALVGNVSLGF
jgi:WD40 repeat protein/DNA-binding SARP family transcriptional activator/class 3 adenylate cyclase